MFFRILVALSLLALWPAPSHAAPAKPTLVVHSTPSGSEVLVDGADAGATPLTLKTLSAGKHAVQVIHPGFHPVSQSVNLKRGQKTSISVKLRRATVLSNAERDRRKQAVGQHSAGLFVWQKVGPGSLVDGLGGGAFFRAQQALAAGDLLLDPVTGYYISVDDPGDGTLTTTYYLDADGTQEAGFVSIDLIGGTVDWEFTAGELDGFSGHMEVSGNSESGSGTLPDGSSWTTSFSIAISRDFQSVAITGAVNLTDADNHTDHWTIDWEVSLTNQGEGGPDFQLKTSDGYTLDFHVDADGSGSGTLKDTNSGKVLATFTFSTDGSLTLVFPDGTTDTVDLKSFLS